MINQTILGDTLNAAESEGYGLYPLPDGGGDYVGGFEVATYACFENVNLTGVRSLDVSYARNAPDVSSTARFAVLWGSGNVEIAENLGEKISTDTGGWEIFQTINVGLAREVNSTGRLCFRGMQGNGILNLASFTLRAAEGENDGVTSFTFEKPTGPFVAPITVVGNEVRFGGEAKSIAGNSLFWSNGKFSSDQFYNADVVKWLKEDWGSQIIRAAMAVDNIKPTDGTPTDELGGYLTQPFDNVLNVRKVVDAAIENGMYVIIDYHAHQAETSTAEAITFFQDMASKYGEFNNVIYEIYNEPINTEWSVIKSYAEEVIAAIRAIDEDNLIIVGTGFYSQEVNEPAEDPITEFDNIAYTLHFYAGTHGEGLINAAKQAMNNDDGKGIALFVTEWGTVNADGFGSPADENYINESWMQFLKDYNISHCNWSISDQVQAGASALNPGASPKGGWSESDLSASGKIVRRIIQNW